MKKTVQVNLSGQVFTLDEDAYDLLSNYLNNIGRLYERSPGKDDILSDIEVRIAELLLERLGDQRAVVNYEDVEEVIKVMGRPEQFEEGLDDDDAGYTTGARQSRSKRLYRDPDGAVVGGVCSGIGYYFGIDPIWIRLAFVAAVIFAGTGVFLYIILWILIPEPKTAAEKLDMKGEPVNIGSIGKTIEDEINSLGDRISKSGGAFGRNSGKKLAGGIDRFFSFLAELIKGLFNIIGKFLGTVFMAIGIVTLIVLIATLTGVADFIHFSNETWSNSMSIYELGELVFESASWFTVSLIGFLLLIGIPFVALVYGGFLLLLPRAKVPYLGASLFGLWFMGMIMSCFSGFNMLHAFSKEETVVDKVNLEEKGLTGDTLVVELGEDVFKIPPTRAYQANRDFLLKRDGDQLIIGNVNFNVFSTTASQASLEVVKNAHAGSYEEAETRTKAITYHFEADSTALTLDASFQYPAEHLLRAQELDVRLLLPIGKTVFLSPGTQRIIRNIPNVTHTYDPYMVGHYWRMEKEGLTCIDCEEETEDKDLTKRVEGGVVITAEMITNRQYRYH